MVKYYVYYSFGGYKDLYLGKSSDNAEASYYIPKIDLSAIDDPQLKEQLKENENKLSGKAAIIDDIFGEYSLPQWTQMVGGYINYWVAMCRNTADSYSLILRKINGLDKDELGRCVPFVFYILVDDADEAQRLFAYIQHNISRLDEIFGNLLHYDAEYNALKFELARANCIVSEALKTHLGALDLPMNYKVPAAIFGSYNEYNEFKDKFGRHSLGIGYDKDGNIMGRSVHANDPENDPLSIAPDIRQEDRDKAEGILQSLKTFFTFTDEDKADLNTIRVALCNIASRRRRRMG